MSEPRDKSRGSFCARAFLSLSASGMPAGGRSRNPPGSR